jgi:hypothetical protein
MQTTWLWFIVVVGGPIVLAVALIWARARTAKVDRRIDPNTPGDDPAKGMHPRTKASNH